MTLKQILKTSLEKYAQQPASSPAAGKSLGASPAPAAAAPSKQLGGATPAASAAAPPAAAPAVDPQLARYQRLFGPAKGQQIFRQRQQARGLADQLHAAHPGARQVSGTFQQGQLVSSQPDAGGMPPMRSSWPDTDMPTSQQVGQLVSDARVRGQNEAAIQQTNVNAVRMMDNADPGGLRTSPLPPAGTGDQLTNADHVRAWATVPGTRFQPLPDGTTAIDISQPTYTDTSNQARSAVPQPVPAANGQSSNLDEWTTLSPEQAATGQRFSPNSYQSVGPGPLQPALDPDAVQQNAQADQANGITPATSPSTPGTQADQPAPNPAAAAGTTQNPAPPQPMKATDTATQELQSLPPDATPEMRAQVEQKVLPGVQAQVQEEVKADPGRVDRARAHLENPDSPEAQKFHAESAQDFVNQVAGGDPNKTQDANFFGQAMGMWDNMGPMGQAAFMIGVPAALIGLLSGDGLSGILGGLGLGALGIGAGAMGMFGEGTQRNMGQLLQGLGGAVGLIPKELQNADALMPGSPQSKEFEAQVKKVFETEGPEAAQRLIDSRVAQFDQLQAFRQSQPELANALTMGMAGEHAPKTRAEAGTFWDRIGKEVVDPARSPTFLRDRAQATAVERLRAMDAEDHGFGPGALQAMFDARARAQAPSQGQDAQTPWQRAWQTASNAVNDQIDPRREAMILQYMQNDPQYAKYLTRDANGNLSLPAGATFEDFAASMMRNAHPELYKSGAVVRRLYHQYMLKAARCWEGYEPVPGAKAYSRGSCRPVGSKKTQKEMKSGKERHHEKTKQGCAQS